MNTANALANPFNAILWGDSDDHFLTENANLPLATLAELLQKPTSAVRKRRQQLGIVKTGVISHHFESMSLSA
jgi:hypothetical protein